MAALFYNFSGDSMFKNGIGSGGLMFCSDLDDFSGSSSNMSIVTDISVRVQDTIQFFQSFDDFIHYYYFGKGVGSITVNLLFFQDTSNSAPGVSKILQKLGEKRGKTTEVSLGNVAFTGVLTDFTLTAMSEPETHYAVSINFAMIDHKLPSANITGGSC
jgi:hypothetical protein